jgi:hypothetical protein
VEIPLASVSDRETMIVAEKRRLTRFKKSIIMIQVWRIHTAKRCKCISDDSISILFVVSCGFVWRERNALVKGR